MSVQVKHGGLLTTIQDLGRYSYQKYGVVVGGAMDEASHKLANLLVGNEWDEATLEMTLIGPELLFLQDSVFAICGAPFQSTVEGELVPIGRPVYVTKGTTLKVGSCKNGCRAYMAFRGGIEAPLILGSRSTYERGGFGGLHGGRLNKEDIIPLKDYTVRDKFEIQKNNFSTTRWFVPSYRKTAVIRVIEGRQYSLFTPEAIRNFFTKKYKISLDSDRMGYRLTGEKLTFVKYVELVSEGTAFGTVQVPPDGQPIVLMADRQTTGGYPKLANVISIDLPLLAQQKPGDEIQFQKVSLDVAQKLYIEKERGYRKLAFILKELNR